MKKFLLSTILLLGLASCNDESLDYGISTQELNVTINENSSRVGFENGTGKFFWTSNDKIGVTTTTSTTSFFPMTLSSESGKSTGTFKGSMSGKPSGYAVYPYIGYENHSITTTGELTYKFPSEYTYSNLDSEYGLKTGNSFNAPMWAKVIEGEGVFFEHLGGVICVTVNNLPIGENQKFILRTTNQITGEFTADLTTSSPKLTTTESNTNNSVTINFSNSTDDATGVFYVPVPTGTYDKITVFVMNGEEEIGIGIWENQVVNQGSLKKASIGEASLEGGTVTVYDVQTAGTLKDLLPTNYLNITSLKVKGNLNGADIAVIREMAGRDTKNAMTEGKLVKLDISEANIVASEDKYLDEIKTSDNVIGNKMFYYTNLESISLPKTITSIGEYAFQYCENLAFIDIPNSVTSIKGDAFSYGYTPKTLNISDLSAWCKAEFAYIHIREAYKLTLNNEEIKELVIPNDVTKISNYVFNYCASITSVTIPETVTGLGSHLFWECTNLTTANISNSVSVISPFLFSNSGLKEVTIGNNVTDIWLAAFENCAIENFYLYTQTPPTLHEKIEETSTTTYPHPFENISQTATLYVPAGCKTIYEANNWADYFGTITEIGESVATVYDVQTAGTLKDLLPTNYLNITSLKVKGNLNGDDIRLIREMAGRDVDGYTTDGQLISLDISEATIVEGGEQYYNIPGIDSQYTSSRTIGRAMFENCNFETLLIPDNTTNIEIYAFDGCANLKTFIVPQEVTVLSYHAFEDCTALESITLPENLEEIDDYAFSGCSNLSSIDIPENVNTIGNFAFRNCKKLDSVVVPEEVKSIRYSFEGCESLKSIDLPSTLRDISGAFENCKSLKNINIPESVYEIYSAFRGCSSLSEITLPAAVTNIDGETFYGCSSLKSIAIHDKVTAIGNSAFCGSGLTTITIPKGVNELGMYIFENCQSLKSAILECDVEKIPDGTFGRCENLQTVVIPACIKEIGENAFSDCTRLEEIHCKATMPPAAIVGAFKNVGIAVGGCTLYVPQGSKSLYETAEGWPHSIVEE